MGLGVLAVMVGLLVVGGPDRAEAQNTAVVLDNVMYWWDHLNCERMINAVNAVGAGADGGGVGTLDGHAVFDGTETFSTTANDSTRQWCLPWAGLGANEMRGIEAAAKRTFRTADGIVTSGSSRVFDMSGWWDGLSGEGKRIAIGATEDMSTAPFSGLTAAMSGRVEAAYNALGGDMPAPAIPIVGLLGLGGLLAGRGWWLRRRRA